jgi:hypothetical protein
MRPIPKPMFGPSVNVLPTKPTGGPRTSGPMPGPVVNRPVARPMGMKKGGSASSRADGIAKKGKTKGKIV